MYILNLCSFSWFDGLLVILFPRYSYAKQTKYTEAIMDYTRVIELDPSNAHAYHNRGISYDKVGDFEKAIADFTKVRDQSPSAAGCNF